MTRRTFCSSTGAPFWTKAESGSFHSAGCSPIMALAMALPIPKSLPVEQLRKLQFLLGEAVGLETLYPPGLPPVTFQAHITGAWEACERFIQLDFYGEVPGYGAESFRALITYSQSKESYRMWAFAASQEEPLHMEGNFQGETLIFVSDPTQMIWGMQRLRYTFTPHPGGNVELLGERWEPDG